MKLEEFHQVKLKSSGYWNLTGTSIHIDNDDPSRNWAITTATNEWCSGSGTWSDPFVIENITINGQNTGHDSILIVNSDVFFSIRNCSLIGGAGRAIYLKNTDNGILINNNCSGDQRGIFLENSNNNTLQNNIINDNMYDGIEIQSYTDKNSNNNIIFNNTIKRNEYNGIYLTTDYYHCDHTTISYNRIEGNQRNGIFFETTHSHFDDNTIFNNSIAHNRDHGIYLRQTINSNIGNNNVFNNTDDGIYLLGSSINLLNNSIIMNEIGIELFHSTIYAQCNNLINNTLYGIYIDEISDDSIIFNNTFIENTINGYDIGINNLWNFGTLGNYWDDYIGTDSNDDGIGDNPYDVSPVGGSLDNYPIWEDGDDLAPDIIINSPTINQVFGFDAPYFDIDVYDYYSINKTWYTIDEGDTNYTISAFTGTINQTTWDNKGHSNITLIFYANDSLGHLGSNEVIISKDILKPIISINAPKSNQLYGIMSPLFSLTIDEPNLHRKWYSLNGGQNITFTSEIRINQAEWDKCGNGTVEIKFYANDTAGNTNNIHTIVRKDANEPSIIINIPFPNQTFGTSSPKFNISIIEENLVICWYTIEGVLGEFSFNGLNGIINQTIWDNIPEGLVRITFFAEDEAGNVGSKVIFIVKKIPVEPEDAIPGYDIMIMIIILLSLLLINLRKAEK
ncbi:MAG: right-handed parallel beta-helix repeat-containing protein [Candidatus Lokiarchaeota archaeon]|nr:right-handed parallel beta-helix repeat-containing protein [Candidatus Lokiarchaeota archaeon]